MSWHAVSGPRSRPRLGSLSLERSRDRRGILVALRTDDVDWPPALELSCSFLVGFARRLGQRAIEQGSVGVSKGRASFLSTSCPFCWSYISPHIAPNGVLTTPRPIFVVARDRSIHGLIVRRFVAHRQSHRQGSCWSATRIGALRPDSTNVDKAQIKERKS
jgi:hypothetical protein